MDAFTKAPVMINQATAKPIHSGLVEMSLPSKPGKRLSPLGSPQLHGLFLRTKFANLNRQTDSFAEPALGCDPEATSATFLFLESDGADFFEGADGLGCP